MLRQRRVLFAIGIALVVLLIWLLAVFNPEGHKLAAVNDSVQQAQSQQNALDARLAQLKAYSKESATFQALSSRLSSAVPATSDLYNYITEISNAASATGVSVQNVNPQTPVSEGNVAVIPLTVSVKGTYDQTLAFMKALYALPRLTVISSVQISGGGNNTSRSTPLSGEFDIDIFAQPAAAQSGSSG